MKNEKKPRRNGRAAFTLIELMVVIVVIAILMGGLFKLLSSTGSTNKRALTIARMQRVENAISGFYALYGTYPPVPQYASPDPLASGTDDYGNSVNGQGADAEKLKAALAAARSQPVAFEFPNASGLSEFVNKKYRDKQVVDVNEAMGGSTADDSWESGKLFKFGLLSFLLPRVEIIFPGISSSGSARENFWPKKSFFEKNQWTLNNPVSKLKNSGSYTSDDLKALCSQREIENAACSRWLPNFEKLLSGGSDNLLGVNTLEDNGTFPSFSIDMNGGNPYRGTSGGSLTTLQAMSIKDGWGNELYYYSAPPYQSYRLWSAGADGRTYPPWIPLDSLPASDRKLAAGWITDDIVGGQTN